MSLESIVRVLPTVTLAGLALVLAPSCDDAEYEGDEVGECSDGADNDQDGSFDCADEGCAGSPLCSGADGDADSDSDADADSDAETDGGTPGSWVLVRAGSLAMRDPDSEGRVDIEVTLTRDFELLSTEVTQAEFEAAMGYNPSRFTACGGQCPVETVSWHEAAAYCNALSDDAGLARCYDCAGSGESLSCGLATALASPQECLGYRLPTEAEWEYAALAGETLTASSCDYPESLAETFAWYGDNSGMTTHRIGLKRANGWGLFDVLGNVWEWCHDWRGEYPSGDVSDPWGPAEPPTGERVAGPFRVLRGGSFGSQVWDVCETERYWDAPHVRYSFVGFRPARSR